jgi:HEAT repeat protein
MDPAGQEYADFVAQLDADTPTARREAAAHLGHCDSDGAVGPLVERFRAESAPSVRRAIVAALGRIAITAYPPNQGPNPRIRSTLEAATGDAAGPVRDAADEWLDRLESRWWA